MILQIAQDILTNTWNPCFLIHRKGGAILFMVKHFLANGVFETAVRNYLKERAYKNANIDHLWEELAYVSHFF